MHLTPAYALAIVALASQSVVALDNEDGVVFWKPRDLFGVVRRDIQIGYHPESTACGSGKSCSDACGGGYEACLSDDGNVHCYNQAASQVCCAGGTGNSCDVGYFCARDSGNATNIVCCTPPDKPSVSLEDALKTCVEGRNVTGSLTSIETAPPETSATSSSSFPNIVNAGNTTATTSTTSTSTECTSTLEAQPTSTGSNSTDTGVGAPATPPPAEATATQTPSTLPVNAASVTGPASVVGVIIAVAAFFSLL